MVREVLGPTYTPPGAKAPVTEAHLGHAHALKERVLSVLTFRPREFRNLGGRGRSRDALGRDIVVVSGRTAERVRRSVK